MQTYKFLTYDSFSSHLQPHDVIRQKDLRECQDVHLHSTSLGQNAKTRVLESFYFFHFVVVRYIYKEVI